jgi:non-ribosomal peptide synthetase-like protein
MMNGGMDAQALAERAAAEPGMQPELGGDGILVLKGPEMPDLIRDELLCEIFAATASRQPDARCMVEGDRVLTYREVDDRATALARGLLQEGIRPGSVVGLWMPRGADLLIAQIAIAKTGAAWLPFDAEAPLERIAVCLEDADAKALFTLPPQASGVEGRIPCTVVTHESLLDPANHSVVNARALGATADHPAYMIYTSGSTGVPKGIVITGRNICHYLRAANVVYGLTDTDVVFQGASVAFDLSMEEIWLPYLVGASLVVATPAVMGDADKLPDLMEAAGVTVLDTVPTLLSMMPRDIASLRVIILGGEACPPALGQRWCRPGRTIFNSYGPTEATVVATVAQVRPGEPVTIGKPIPNYTCYVVDDALNALGTGVEGELLIGGPGVAKGYLRREQLTAEKFIANPFHKGGMDPILYRSGDAVVVDDAGDILFRGRIDDQVKIRGFRVELGEIEAKLAELPGIGQAAVVLRNDDGLDQLVAFLTLEAGAELDQRGLRTELRQKLPPYMVPSRFETLRELPRLPSGKVNRNVLKKAHLTAPAEAAEEQEEPRTQTEAQLLEAAKAVLPPQPIPFDADFFTDLGGHSLVAARFLAIVRQHHHLASLTLQDVYGTRTLRAMGELLDGRAVHAAPPRDLSFDPPPLLRRFLCGVAQAITLPIVIALLTAQWLGVFVSYMLLTGPDADLLQEVISLLGVYACINIATIVISIAMKWVLIGRTKPGRYPLWGSYYFRWWLSQRFIGLAHTKWFQGTPIMRLYLKSLGAKVGDDAIISEIEVGAIDLLSIGAGCSIGQKVKFANARAEGNEFIIGAIEIGDDAYIGTSCTIEEDVVIGRSAELRDLTSINCGMRIGAAELWDGSPGQKVGMVDVDALPPQSDASPTRRALQTCVYTLLLLVVPPLGLLPIFPAFWVFDRIDEVVGVIYVDRFTYLASIPLMAWPTSFALVLVTVALIAAIRWMILPRVREGRYSIHSWFYVRKWAVALATEVTLETLSSLFATIYMRAWYRLMGAKIGKDAEISTNLSGRYDLVEIGEKCFIADEVILGDEDVRRGYMTLEYVRTAARVFVGNDAVVPPGTDIPAGALIGIKSKPPSNAQMSEGDTWFGSPPMKLPVRQKFDAGQYWTYEPPKWKKLARGIFEAIHISLPTMLFITFGTWAVELLAPALLAGHYLKLTIVFIACSLAISIAMTLIVIAVKWVTMGRYEPVVKPMWSFWAMRTEAVAVMYWGLAGKVLLDHLRGTPFLPWVLRLFGAHFGKGVWMDMTDITEFDCIHVGNYCSINALAALQTHLYEDRVMKIGRIHLEDGVTVGAGATVLYDTHIGRYARLGPLTVIMKGEAIPANTEWVGAPAQPRLLAQVQPRMAAE